MGAEKKVQSTLIGLKYPSRRDEGLRTGANWLRGRREDDGAEGLWRIGDKLYDLNGWIDKHPGGAEWLTLSKGIDITVAFEVRLDLNDTYFRIETYSCTSSCSRTT